MLRETPGQRVRRFRLEAGLSLRNAANLAGISHVHWWRVEHDKPGVSATTRKVVAFAFDVPVIAVWPVPPRRRNRRGRRAAPRGYDACLTAAEASAPNGACSEDILDRADTIQQERPTDTHTEAVGPPVSTPVRARCAARPRERRATATRSSSRGSPDGDPDEPEPALGRTQAQAGAVK